MGRHNRWYAVRLAAAVAAAASVAGVLGACTPDPKPTASPSASSSSATPTVSASASPTVSPSPSIPPEASVQTPEGAAAFVKFFIAQYNQGLTKPDPSALAGLYEAGCDTCSNFEQRVKRLEEQGQKYESAPNEVTSIVTVAGAPEGQAWLDLTIQERAVAVVDANGAVVSTQTERTGSARAATIWREGRWLLYGFGAA